MCNLNAQLTINVSLLVPHWC